MTILMFAIWIIGVIVNWAIGVLVYCADYRPRHRWFYAILTLCVIGSWLTWLVLLAMAVIEENDRHQ